MKFKFKMWRSSWIILIGYLLFFILDLTSTLSAGELVKYMETNVAYIYAGWPAIIIINLFVLYILLKAYDSNIHNSFMAITSFVWLSLLRIAVIINNYSIGAKVQSGEITKTMVEGVSTVSKINHHVWFIALQLLLPLIVTMVIYTLFQLDHKISKK